MLGEVTGTLTSAPSIPWAALGPIVVITLGFAVYCWVDIARHSVKYLPKWAWAIICVASIPIGGIVYLMVGRDELHES